MKEHKPDGSGLSKSQKLAQFEKTWGTKLPQAEVDRSPEFPYELEFIWDFFCQLRGSAGMGFSAPNPITFSEILALSQIHGVTITPWEVSAIKSLDRVFEEEHVNTSGTRSKD